ncbi:hypothetical protein PLEOSDRAFT_1048587 [Pleurotus ostreatus PC15]|uniref:CxC2-like cysteine cluster KDZ transposase-associated domain-containing protein n=1 Tax=Pleurotus ostreatus (strain PC15) TaxID=1137138 RepID=A0A067N777_PLEO1|nr:hypothetical protein PLEOSDRAFT_1048587 [Pleurotus ostreatus PC15]
MQALQSKVTMYDYYMALEKLTENRGFASVPKRYKEFVRMTRQYRYLTALKRGGRAHVPSGILGTGNGELGIQCPACPTPGVNLPLDWESAPPDQKFLYTLFLALDACFRLKRRIVSSVEKDPGLGIDWSYFVENEPFRRYILTVTDQKEMSTCSGLAALDYANTKFSRGYAATGVCLGVCARHEIIQRNGAADLQVGERYCNMDYCLASLLRHHDPKLNKLVSYDIVCQWSKHVLERLQKLPPLVRLKIASNAIRFAIPKLHIHGHTQFCQRTYSLNYLPGVGRTDGEGIKRPWANIGATSTSTRAMGPGARIEMLNDHWSHWNWQKIIGMGQLFAKRLRLAIAEREVQQESFEIFSSKQAERIDTWKAMVSAFEADGSKPNPYEIPSHGITEADVRLRLAKLESEDAGKGVPALHEVGPSGFIVEGLEIEETQRRISAYVKKASGSAQKLNGVDMRTKLTRSLARLRVLQGIYTPCVIHKLTTCDTPDEEEAESCPLLLPSALTPEERLTCAPGLVQIEQELRDAQCRSALNELRTLLFIKARLVGYKDRNARHQHANTRARILIERNEDRIKLQTQKYQAAWRALTNMSHDVGWPQLKQEHIRCMDDPDTLTERHTRLARQVEKDGVDTILVETGVKEGDVACDAQVEGETVGEERRVAKEGYRTISWIWVDGDYSEESMSDGMDTGK